MIPPTRLPVAFMIAGRMVVSRQRMTDQYSIVAAFA